MVKMLRIIGVKFFFLFLIRYLPTSHYLQVYLFSLSVYSLEFVLQTQTANFASISMRVENLIALQTRMICAAHKAG